MLKKFLLASSLLAVSSSVALASPVPYIGAGLGITTNTSSRYFFNSYRGMPVNVFAGYGGVVNNQNIYLAGELTGTVANAALSNSNTLRTTYSYGASVLPGVMLSDHTLAFARVGVVRTRFSDLNNSQTGAQLGLGMQTSLTSNVDVRGEYDFTAYGTTKRRFYGSTAPRMDAFNLGVVYKFD